jgi:hypothetical protein
LKFQIRDFLFRGEKKAENHGTGRTRGTKDQDQDQDQRPKTKDQRPRSHLKAELRTGWIFPRFVTFFVPSVTFSLALPFK